MRHKVLKSLLGKYICARRRIAYIHVDRVIITEGNKAIVTAVVNTLDDALLHWFLEIAWTTSRYGIHRITGCKILKEDELDGYGDATQNQAL